MENIQLLEEKKKSTEWYLRALWDDSFILRKADVEYDHETPVSYVSGGYIFLPELVKVSASQLSYYRAAACHAAAHIIYGNAPFDIDELNPIQRCVVGLVEDLRVELLSIRQFPGLRQLWLSFHYSFVDRGHSAQSLLLRLSRKVLDPDDNDEDDWVNKGKRQILGLMDNDDKQSSAVEIGLALANDLGQMRLPLNSGRYEQIVLYRDDNRCIWQKEQSHYKSGDTANTRSEASWKNTLLVEQPGGTTLSLAHHPGPEDHGYILKNYLGDDLIYKESPHEITESCLQYPEWDYKTQVFKRDWCTVIEKKMVTGSDKAISMVKQRYKYVLNRLKRVSRRLYTEKLYCQRKLEEGDEIDYYPMLNAMVSIRGGEIPDSRIFMRNSIKQDKDTAVSIVIDLSESTNDVLPGTDIPVYKLLRDSVILLGEALTTADEAFAIYGFSSNSRHQVMVQSFKSFDETFADCSQRLSEIKGGYSTRMGAAIRHCAQKLAVQPQQKKLLLVITDGVPSDIDVFDNQYLHKDSWHAVHELERTRIKPFCVNLDPRADKTIENIFGKQRYETLCNINRLPEILSRVYFRAMRC